MDIQYLLYELNRFLKLLFLLYDLLLNKQLIISIFKFEFSMLLDGYTLKLQPTFLGYPTARFIRS